MYMYIVTIFYYLRKLVEKKKKLTVIKINDYIPASMYVINFLHSKLLKITQNIIYVNGGYLLSGTKDQCIFLYLI